MSHERTTSDLKLFSGRYVDELYRVSQQTESRQTYTQDEFSYEEHYSKGPSEIFMPEIFLDPSKEDVENAITLYEALKDINETQATDERLWVTLTHRHFWKYMQKRWPVAKAKKPLSRIRDRYFLRSLNLRSLTRNGIARLWWYCRLTHDTSNPDPYELTKVLLKRADLVVGVTERALGSNPKILIGVLKALQECPEVLDNEDKTRTALLRLNLAGGVKNLAFLEQEEINRLAKEIVTEVQ